MGDAHSSCCTAGETPAPANVVAVLKADLHRAGGGSHHPGVRGWPVRDEHRDSARAIATATAAIKARSYHRSGGGDALSAHCGATARRILAVPVPVVVAIDPPSRSSPDVPPES